MSARIIRARILPCTAAWFAVLFAALPAQGMVTPDSPRYVEKMTEEQLAVALAGTQAEKATLCMQYAGERIREMKALALRRRFQHHEALAHAWRVLTVEGAMKAARQGSLSRRDMRQTYRQMAQEMHQFELKLKAHAAESLPENARAAVEAASTQAGMAAQETEEALARETDRVARHEVMLARARTELTAQLKADGHEDAEALAARVTLQCRYHERVRVRLMASLLADAKAGENTPDAVVIAARANGLCEAGFTQEGAGAMVQALQKSPGLHRERVRALREAQGICRQCPEEDRAALAAELSEVSRVAQKKGMTLKAQAQVMRQIRRAQRQGMPAKAMAGHVKTELLKLGYLGNLGSPAQKSMKAVQKLRKSMEKKARQHRDRLRKRAESAAAKAAKKGK
jgi:hypothetical protein